MSTKEAKAALKSARDELKAKNFTTAVQKCKDILKWEPLNYNALIILAAATQELGDFLPAKDAFKRAIDAMPDQLTAWQGLRAFYEIVREKSKAFYDAEDHLKVNAKLVDLFRASKDGDKACDAALRLAEVYSRLDRRRDALKALSSVLDLAQDGTLQKAKLWRKTIELVRYFETPTAEEELQLITGLKYIIHHRKNLGEDASPPDLADYEKLLKLLWQKGLFDDFVTQAQVTLGVFPNASYPVEMLCQLFVEGKVKKDALDVQEILEKADTQTTATSTSPWVALARGMSLFQCGKDVARAKKELESGLRRQTCLQAILVYAQVLLALKDETGAYHVLTRAGQDVQSTGDSSLVDFFNVLLIKAMIGSGTQKKLESAKDLLKNLPKENQDAATLLKLYIGLKDWENAQTILKEIPDNHEKALAEFQVFNGLGDIQEARKSLEKIPQKDDIPVEHRVKALLFLGQLEEQSGEAAKALTCYLQAAKLDQNDHTVFSRLGRYYLSHCDFDRAVKCFTRAKALNGKDLDAAAGLADCHVRQKDYSAAAAVLEPLTKAFGLEEAEQVWYRLAVVTLLQDQAAEAVQLFQRVIRCDPNNALYWQFMGDAYCARGAYNSALKSYARAFELDGSSVYSACACGEVLKIQKEFLEAKQWFDKALSLDPNYLPALVSAGQSLLGEAQCFKDQILDAKARDFVEEGFKLVDRAVKLGLTGKEASVIVRKLGGDFCSLCWAMDPDFVLRLPARLVNPTSRRQEVDVTGQDLADLAVRFYTLAAKGAPDRAEAWLDVALALENKAALVGQGVQRTTLLSQAVKVYMRALKLNPKLPVLWNNLGILLAKGDAHVELKVSREALAQHCFIQSTKLDPRIAAPWFNLGILYMSKEEYALCNAALAKAQVCDPDDVNPWVGQAMLSEKLANRSTSMDLFRHSAQLAFHSESALCYARWVLDYLLNPDSGFKKSEEYKMQIEKLQAVGKAYEGLVRYVRRRPSNPVAFTALGQLCERLGLWRQAKDNFLRAVDLVASGSCVESWGREEQMSSSLRLHAGRCCLKLRDDATALDLFRAVKNPTLRTNCWLAFAQLRNKDLKSAKEILESSLEWLQAEEDDKPQVYCVLAAVAFNRSGGNVEENEEPKKWLFKSIKEGGDKMSHALRALCALGLLSSDNQLVGTVVEAMDGAVKAGFDDGRELAVDAFFFRACQKIIAGDEQGGLKQLAKGLHMYPQSDALWRHLALFLLQFAPNKSREAANAAETAAFIKCSDSKTLALATLGHLMSGRNVEALRCAQRACFLYPDSVNNWCALVSAAFPAATTGRGAEDGGMLESLRRILGFVRQYSKGKVDRAVTSWLIRYDKKLMSIASPARA